MVDLLSAKDIGSECFVVLNQRCSREPKRGVDVGSEEGLGGDQVPGLDHQLLRAVRAVRAEGEHHRAEDEHVHSEHVLAGLRVA